MWYCWIFPGDKPALQRGSRCVSSIRPLRRYQMRARANSSHSSRSGVMSGSTDGLPEPNAAP